MNQSNYALLTALYDSQSSDLYKDIYFPTSVRRKILRQCFNY